MLSKSPFLSWFKKTLDFRPLSERGLRAGHGWDWLVGHEEGMAKLKEEAKKIAKRTPKH